MPEVLRAPLPAGLDAARVHLTLCGDRTDSFWLDSAGTGTSFIGRGEPWHPADPVLESLRTELGRWERSREALGLPIGLVGWLGYEVGAELLGLARGASRPPAAFLRVTRGVAINPDGSGEVFALAGDAPDEARAWMARTLHALSSAAVTTASARSPLSATAPSLTWSASRAEYLDAIGRAQAAIRDGDAYVLNLTNEVMVPGSFDPVAAFLALRSETPAHHGGLLRIGETSLVSSSPEKFLGLDADGWLDTHPVKGTIARAVDAAGDLVAAEALRSSDKERAENLMIVDLMRNDLTRVCDPATVTVTDLFRVETLPRIHQLVSSIRGLLRPGLDIVDALASCFPAGSMTGAPKRRAAEILSGLEQRERGLYAGTFGYLAIDGTADLAMTIRSIVIEPGGASVSAGGGITALSDPGAEVDEVSLKARPMLQALGLHLP